MTETVTMKMRGRPVTHEEALASAQRLINSHFHNPDSARVQIPCSPHDDDVMVMDYIHEQMVRGKPQFGRSWLEDALPLISRWLRDLPDGVRCLKLDCLDHTIQPCKGCGRIGGIRGCQPQ
jgi:hypothetical protein